MGELEAPSTVGLVDNPFYPVITYVLDAPRETTNSFSDYDGTNWWLQDRRQAEWGVYFDIPFSQDGLRDNVLDGTHPAKPPIISTSPDEWRERAGFVVELWRTPIGTVPSQVLNTAGTGQNEDNLVDPIMTAQHHGQAERIWYSVVDLNNRFKFESIIDPGFDPSQMDNVVNGDVVSRYGMGELRREDAIISFGGEPHTTLVSLDGELHIKGVVSFETRGDVDGGLSNVPPEKFRVDSTQYAYYVMIKCYLSGNRMYGSSNAHRLAMGDPDEPDAIGHFAPNNPPEKSEMDMFVVLGQDEVTVGIGSESCLQYNKSSSFWQDPTIINPEPHTFAAWGSCNNLKQVPPPHGSSVNPSDNVSKDAHQMPTLTLRGVRVTSLTDKP
jgi:hypothetical protein